ncbi:MAG: dihydropteroate synthase [Deltaproteobacteria bacterium]|nr:dihydropteroate synthase [Deltaproteobacteria bacterium]
MGGRTLDELFPDLGRRTLVMGILNVTPDSFSDGGRYGDVDAAVEAALTMLAQGADVVDIGGESTRPGSDPVSLEEELRRVIPVVEALAELGIQGLSVDTTKAEVARRAVAAGAGLVNDVSALTFDPEMADAVAALGVPLVLSHTRARPKTMQQGELTYEGGVLAAVIRELEASIAKAVAAGLPQAQLIVDPGIGFGKDLDQNLALIRGLDQLKAALRRPVLIGTSRKSFLGALTGQPAEARDAATLASVVLAIQYGADMVRVHDVPGTVDAVKVADALVRVAAPTGL